MKNLLKLTGVFVFMISLSSCSKKGNWTNEEMNKCKAHVKEMMSEEGMEFFDENCICNSLENDYDNYAIASNDLEENVDKAIEVTFKCYED